MSLEAYTDANYTRSMDDRRSTFSDCTFLKGNPSLHEVRNKMWLEDHAQKQNSGQWHFIFMSSYRLKIVLEYLKMGLLEGWKAK